MPLLGGVGRASGIGAITALLLLDQGASLLAATPAGGPTTVASGAAGPSGGSTAVAANDTRPAGSDTTYDWQLPRGFPTPAVPADNAMSAAKVALGRRLFFEPRLSITGQHSCASCHEPGRAYTDGRALAVGATGQPLPHSAMSLVNVAYNISFGWSKPEVQSLEAQMLEP
ncbi:MAG: cytochrome c peroxidase, partial [Gammaproteobacteria bacterium]|nr:cytochrome c peroxidase [Gammaproteobacteria bacterium]